MNNNFEKINEFSHDTIDLINKLGHEVLECAVNNSIPIINNLSNSNIPKNESNVIYPNYYIKSYDDSIYIYVEIPGVEKNNCDCKVNIKNNILKISAKVKFEEKWNFIKNKNYYRTIKLSNCYDKESINATIENGALKIIINKELCEFESNININ